MDCSNSIFFLRGQFVSKFQDGGKLTWVCLCNTRIGEYLDHFGK